MEDFVYCDPTKIYFGRGAEEQVGEIVRAYTDHVLLVYGQHSIKKSGLYDRILASLAKADVAVTGLAGIVGNPRLSAVYEGIELCRRDKITLILAVGGGSVIDTAKAISVGVPYKGDVWDFYIKKAVPSAALAVGAIPTMTGAGSEMSNSNVITREEEHLKRSFDSDLIYPRFSILDPELTLTAPSYPTACGAYDILSHLMERYFTRVKHVDVTDRLLEGVMRTVLHYAPLVLKEPDNYDYRAELMWASVWAQNGSLSTGRIGDWGCHAIEHELSGEYDIPHGEGLSMITASWMRYVCKKDMDRFEQFARRVFDVDFPSYDQAAAVEEGIIRLESFSQRLGLCIGTSRLEMSEEDIERLAGRAVAHSPVRGRFLKMKAEDIAEILRIASKR